MAAGVGVRASFFCKSFSRCTLLARLATSSVRPFSTLLLQLSSCSVVLSFSAETLLSLATSDRLLGDAAAASSGS